MRFLQARPRSYPKDGGDFNQEASISVSLSDRMVSAALTAWTISLLVWAGAFLAFTKWVM